MPINISAYERLTPQAVIRFWVERNRAAKAQAERGASDAGNRSAVTAGKNLDGFVEMVKQVIVDNGLRDFEVFSEGRSKMNVPGFYRPTKNWDLIIVSRQQLVAAIEFKSQVGSLGNNFNNRVEEALGNSADLLRAFREGVFGVSSRPFLGFFFVLEDTPDSQAAVRIQSPHFQVLAEFPGTSYAERYRILCQKLVRESMYDAASLILTDPQTGPSGNFRTLSVDTSGERFVSLLAARIAAFVAETRK